MRQGKLYTVNRHNRRRLLASGDWLNRSGQNQSVGVGLAAPYNGNAYSNGLLGTPAADQSS